MEAQIPFPEWEVGSIEGSNCGNPSLLLSLFRAPIGVIGMFEKLMRGFLWGNHDGRHRIAWIALESVCKSLDSGGLGLGFLAWRNKALLIKWAWRFGASPEDMWRKLVCAKYGWDCRCRVLHLLVDRLENCSIIMQDILKSTLEDTMLGKYFREQLICSVGGGDSIRFWLDPWLSTDPLFVMFPRLFSLALDKTGMIQDMGIYMARKWTWTVEFRRQPLGWELDEYDNFMAAINSLMPCQGNDGLLWIGEQNGRFSVKSLYDCTEAKIFSPANWCVPSRVRKIVPPKTVLFLWQASNDKIAVNANLIARGMVMDNMERCVI